VTQLAARIDGTLKAGMAQAVRFSGEVSGFRDGDHWYFTIKDAGAAVNCVLWRSGKKNVKFTPTNGQQVLAKGRVEFYAPQGRVSVILDSLEPVGAGALDLAFRALCEELRGLGWFAEERKRPLPHFPAKIAVVTSRTAAALQDVLVTMRKRCPAVGVLLVDCRVQGQGAAEEVAAAIREVGGRAKELGVEAVLVTRGGGSMEDLWTFNERAVAQAIVECPVPVVAAIGHETDTTIAELVADLRAATPTQAAMRLTPDVAALAQQVHSVGGRLAMLVRQGLESRRRLLESVASRPVLASPHRALEAYELAIDRGAEQLVGAVQASVSRRRAGVDRLALRLERCRPAAQLASRASRVAAADVSLRAALRHRLDRLRAGVDAAARQLEAVSPLRVLERGYSVTTTADGTLVRRTADAPAGSELLTRVADGVVRSRVEGPPPDPATESARRSPRGKGTGGTGQGGSLFA
jgi:exodeoxyribonuclease VII large subunit